MNGRAVALKDVRIPIFALGAERDHIAPWRSVYKIELLGSAETTFVLTGGGHNSSVVSPPGKPGAYYWISRSPAGADFIDPDAWLKTAPRQEGSWWPEWAAWLHARSTENKTKARQLRKQGASRPSLGDAPGHYVFG